MPRKYMILPNAIVLACAVILFHRSFLSGHITWIGSLVTLSALLPLLYCLIGRMPRLLKYFAALLNAILFFNCCYAFVGIVNMLYRSGTLDWRFYLVLGVLWAAALGMAFVKPDRTLPVFAVAANLVFCALGALGLYVRSGAGWAPWMTAVLFGALIAASGLNVFLLVGLRAFQNRDRPS